MLRKFPLLLLALMTPALAAVKIQAVILDANTHREVYGVNVFIDRSTIGTISGRNGAFQLEVPADYANALVQFQHISYNVRRISLDSLQSLSVIYLVPRVIPLQDVEVIGKSTINTIDIQRDIPQSIKVLDAGKFDIRGYVDAGDFLNIEPAVQVQEELSGKKTLSIRGGNADDVIVLYNGVRMNSPFDNVFDFSLIDLANLERFEVIKGSNTSLYGPEAFSGVINIVPQVQRDYMAFAQYRMGTYNTENLNLQLNKSLGPVVASYSFKDASQVRHFIDAVDESDQLQNIQQHHNANLNFHIGPASTLNAMYSRADLTYDNGRDGETVAQKNDVASLKYGGAIGPLGDVNLLAAWKAYDETQRLNYNDLDLNRHIQDQSLQFDADKTVSGDWLDLLLGYSFRGAGVDFDDDREQGGENIFHQATKIDRRHHGVVAIVKTHGSAGQGFLQTFNIDLSLRYDSINDKVPEQKEMPSSPELATNLTDQSWQAAHFKFATSLDGYRDDLAFKAFLNYGANTKFPTVVQRLSVPFAEAALYPDLTPERVRSLEVGAELFKEDRSSTVLDGWHAEGAVFRNYYTDKFRPFYTPGVPVVFYDNVPIADIYGMEASFNVYFLHKKIDLEFGIANYDISEKSAFPFKSELKRTIDLSIDHAGFSLLLHWFYESEQVAWIRTFSGPFAEVALEPFSNLDVHLSKSFRFNRARFFINISGRNVLNTSEVALQGLAIRDHRAYLTVGAQF